MKRNLGLAVTLGVLLCSTARAVRQSLVAWVLAREATITSMLSQ